MLWYGHISEVHKLTPSLFPIAGGQFLAGEPVESNLPNNSVSEHPMMSTEPFLPKRASTFSQYNQHPTQLQPLASSSNEHVGPRFKCHSILTNTRCLNTTTWLIRCSKILHTWPANEAFATCREIFTWTPSNKPKQSAIMERMQRCYSSSLQR